MKWKMYKENKSDDIRDKRPGDRSARDYEPIPKDDHRTIDLKKPYEEIDESGEGESSPRIYVGTYAKYNDGSIDGEWVDINDFSTYEDFVDYCREIHSDERDPEFMVQDFEGFPREWYHESGLPTEEEFDKMLALSELSSDQRDAYASYLKLGRGDDSIEAFYDSFQGEFHSPSDFASYVVDQVGMPELSDSYFDYKKFGRDLMYEYSMGDPSEEDDEGNPQDEDHYYDQDGHDMGEYNGDRDVGETFVKSMGGIKELGQETIDMYFDYDSFGRDLLIDDYTEQDGYIFSNY